jgi:RHS repeat-associated protein
VTEEFTGKELDDETGLNYFGARYYDPMIGIWNTVDPARQFTSPYLYVGSWYNPLNGIDPNGAIFGWIDKIREAHYARNKLNNPPPNINEAFQRADGKLLSTDESIYHMNGSLGKQNKKFVFADGSEGVYNSMTGLPDNSHQNMGTYNYMNSKGIMSIETFGHFVYDMIPYWIWGNNEFDTTPLPDRVFGPSVDLHTEGQAGFDEGGIQIEHDP